MKHFKYISLLIILGCNRCTKDPVHQVIQQQTKPSLIICDGNSRTENPKGGYGGGVGYPEYLQELVDCEVKNFGVSGQTTLAMLSDVKTQVDPLYKPNAYVIVWEFSNHIFFYGDQDEAYRKLVEYCQGRKEIGFKVIVCTSPHYDLTALKVDTTRTGEGWASFNKKLDYVNNLIRQNYKSFADKLVDFDKRFPESEFRSEMWFDGVHFTEQGRRVQAQLVYDEIK